MLGYREVADFLRRENNSACAFFEGCLELGFVSISDKMIAPKLHTKGMMSAGCVVSLCASSSL